MAFLALLFHGIGFGQVLACPELSIPSDGATDVSVNTDLEWNAITGATGYLLSIGTTPGGAEILDQLNVGNVISINLETNLPPESDIYVTIFPFDSSGINMTCTEFQFTTGMTNIPRCTEIINPRDGDALVPVNQNITWIRDFAATGYLMTVVESDPNGVRILDNEPVGNGTNFKPPNFKPRTRYYVTITPFNEAGPAENCEAISFTTGDPLPTPDCAVVLSPADGLVDVPVDVTLEWATVNGVDGYLLSVGTMPSGTDIVDNLDMGENTAYTLPDQLPMGTRIYVKVASYKNGEMSESCVLHSFVIVSAEIPETEEFIPRFFTPNSDGFNDEWKVNPPENISIRQILVFDRFGLLLKQMGPLQSWDGTYNGRRLPSGSYWYAVQLNDAPQIRGFFALKR
ncbi:MAG: T9SS type B sorting domain-containing protein [Aurantibacter sp.]